MHPREALRNPESSRDSEKSSYWMFGEASMACPGVAKERLLRWLRGGEERHRWEGKGREGRRRGEEDPPV